MPDVSKYPYLFAALLEDGWTEKDLAKLANENFLRVFKQVEKIGKQMSKELKPIDTWIDEKDLIGKFKSCRTA